MVFRPGRAGQPGGVLSAEQAKTLQYFRYDPATNALEAVRTVATEPTTLEIGNHSMSSGGENVFFTNLSTNVDWSPAWAGLKDQSLAENQGITGVIPPTFRHYTSDILQLAVEPPHASIAVPYILDRPLPATIAVFAQHIIVEEAVAPTDWLRYQVYRGTFEDDDIVYLQILTGQTLSPGDTLRWNFKIPLEGFVGTQTHTRLSISKGDQDGEYTPILARARATTVADPYTQLHYRLFSDEDVLSGVLFTTADRTIRYAAEYAVDTTGGPVTLTVASDIGYKSFIVFDASQNFNLANCTIDFGAPQGAVVLSSKNASFKYYHDGTQWRFLDLNTKAGGIV